MSIRAEAEENLRVIRSLMEKATVYRAISAPGALVGGLCSVVLAASAANPNVSAPIRFLDRWIYVLAITALANFSLLRRDADRRGEPFVSAGMRLALRAMLPGLVAGAACTFVVQTGNFSLLASLWVLLYGISLLAASHFAPKSICWLGRAFFVAGAALLLAVRWVTGWAAHVGDALAAHLIMGSTFGLFHLIYAACVWPRKSVA